MMVVGNFKEYKLTTCNDTVKTFKHLKDLEELLATDKTTKLTDNEICFLSSGMDIKRNDDKGFVYKVDVISTNASYTTRQNQDKIRSLTGTKKELLASLNGIMDGELKNNYIERNGQIITIKAYRKQITSVLVKTDNTTMEMQLR